MPLADPDTGQWMVPAQKKPDPNDPTTSTTTTPTTDPTTGVTSNSPIPGVDPFAISAASDAYNRAVASINAQRAAALTSYGFRATGYDDQGNPIGLEVDPTSQFGQYQQLLNSEALSSMQAADSSSGRGFSGGLANQAESRLKYNAGAQNLALGQGLLGTLSGLQTNQSSALDDYNNAIVAARLAAAQAAQSNGDWTPTTQDPGSSDDSTPGNKSSTPNTSGGSSTKTTAAATAAAKALANKVVAKAVTANKTGATASKARGVISIH